MATAAPAGSRELSTAAIHGLASREQMLREPTGNRDAIETHVHVARKGGS